MQRKKLIKNFKARVQPLTILILLIGLAFTTIFIINPFEKIVVSGAETSQFVYKKSITINHNQVEDTFTNFTICINITDTDLINNALDNAYDIAFFNSSTDNQLDHEIEFFDGSTGKLCAWVQVDELSAYENTVIDMYYGDIDIGTPAWDIEGTWESDYRMVQHLNETDLDGGAGDIKDSTSNNNDGQTFNLDGTDSMTGCFGKAMDFTDGKRWINVTDDNTLHCTAITIVLWAKGENFSDTEGNNAFHCVCKRHGTDNRDSFSLAYADHTKNGESNENWDAMFYDTGGNSDHLFEDKDRDYSTPWMFIASTFDTSYKARIYTEGIQQNISTSQWGDPLDYDSQPLTIGTEAEFYQSRWFDGYIDEVRILNGKKSTGWVITTYNSMQNATDEGFYTLGVQYQNVDGTYEKHIPNNKLTFSGEAGDNVWANDTGDGTTGETIKVFSNVTNTENCTDICIILPDASDCIYSENFYIEIRNTTDGSWDGTTASVPNGGNVTINSTTWTTLGAHGTNPFPIFNFNSVIEIRVKVAIPEGCSSGAKTNSANCYIQWRIDTE